MREIEVTRATTKPHLPLLIISERDNALYFAAKITKDKLFKVYRLSSVKPRYLKFSK